MAFVTEEDKAAGEVLVRELRAYLDTRGGADVPAVRRVFAQEAVEVIEHGLTPPEIEQFGGPDGKSERWKVAEQSLRQYFDKNAAMTPKARERWSAILDLAVAGVGGNGRNGSPHAADPTELQEPAAPADEDAQEADTDEEPADGDPRKLTGKVDEQLVAQAERLMTERDEARGRVAELERIITSTPGSLEAQLVRERQAVESTAESMLAAERERDELRDRVKDLETVNASMTARVAERVAEVVRERDEAVGAADAEAARLRGELERVSSVTTDAGEESAMQQSQLRDQLDAVRAERDSFGASMESLESELAQALGREVDLRAQLEGLAASGSHHERYVAIMLDKFEQAELGDQTENLMDRIERLLSLGQQ